MTSNINQDDKKKKKKLLIFLILFILLDIILLVVLLVGRTTLSPEYVPVTSISLLYGRDVAFSLPAAANAVAVMLSVSTSAKATTNNFLVFIIDSLLFNIFSKRIYAK